MAGEGSGLRPHPKTLVDEACERFGLEVVNAWCVELIGGACSTGDDSWPAICWLGGKTSWPEYWGRVWGARGLLYCWDDVAVDSVIAALQDEHWRVREMAAKVVRRHEIGEAADAVAELLRDCTPRVSAAAARALGLLGEGEHAEVLKSATESDQELVVAAASAALIDLERRLDRPL